MPDQRFIAAMRLLLDLSMNPAQAFAAICLAAVGCDGQLGRDEAHALRAQLEYRSPFSTSSEQEMGELFDQLLTQLRQQGWENLINQAIPALSPTQRETVLALAAHLVRADRQVQPIEESFLQHLSLQLGLPAGRADRILEVVALLHRDALA
jgi:uncharacterized tellurite resistance protein B-like protein